MQLRLALPNHVLSMVTLRSECCAVEVSVDSREDRIRERNFGCVSGRFNEEGLIADRAKEESCRPGYEGHARNQPIFLVGELRENEQRIFGKIACRATFKFDFGAAVSRGYRETLFEKDAFLPQFPGFLKIGVLSIAARKANITLY
jgi:hypothetical protein